MRSLRWIGLVCSLLIVGVLGGLMAPLPSEADPVSLQMEIKDVTAGTVANTTTIVLGGVTTCLSGGNYCYGLPTSDVTYYGSNVNRQFKIVNGDNQTAQVQVTDFGQSNCNAGQTTCDNIVLTGVKFVPVCVVNGVAGSPCTSTQWPNNQKVTLKLTLSNTFNQQPGGAADGTSSFYMYGMSVGGYFASNSIGDISQVYGKGTFSQNCKDPNGTTIACPIYNISNNQNPDADLTVNSVGCKPDTTGHVPPQSPLCWTVAYPGGTSQLTFTATQVQAYYPGSPSGTRTVGGVTSPYPFGCSNNLVAANKSLTDVFGATIRYTDPSCQPSLTVTYLFTLLGADSVILSASGDSGGVGPCGGKKQPSCDCSSTNTHGNRPPGSSCDALTKFLVDHKKKTDDLQTGIPPSSGCDPVICSGALNNSLNVTPDPPKDSFCLSTDMSHSVPCDQFPFIAAGPRVDSFVVTAVTGQGTVSFTALITGAGGTEITVTPDYPNWPQQPGTTATSPKYYAIDQINVYDANGIEVTAPNVVVASCPGGDKGPLTIYNIPQSGTYTAKIHAHNSTTPGMVCP